MHAFKRGLRPGGVLLGRADEQHIAASGVRAEPLDDGTRSDHVPLGARHLLAVRAEDHPLGEQSLEGLLHVE